MLRLTAIIYNANRTSGDASNLHNRLHALHYSATMTVFDSCFKRDRSIPERYHRVFDKEPRLGCAELSRVWQSAGVVEWLMAPGCKPGGLRLYEGSNPSPSTRIQRDVRGETAIRSIVAAFPSLLVGFRAGVAQW